MTRGFMEFRGIFSGIPWKSWVAKSNVTEFHWAWLFLIQMTSGFPALQQNFLVESMELLSRHNKYHRVPLNYMELGWRCFKWHGVSWNSVEYSMEFNAPNWAPIEMTRLHGISCNILWNSMEILSRQIKCHQIQWSLIVSNSNDTRGPSQ